MKTFIERARPFVPLLITLALIAAAAATVVITNRDTFFAAKHVSTAKLDMDIAAAEKRVATKPSITPPYIALASMYLQKARETSDANYYNKVDLLMDQATKVNPKDADIPALRASAQLGRHHFKEAKQFTQEALALNTTTATYYGLDGDANIELGQYQAAVDDFQKMTDIRPSFSSWSRIAYIRELYGDTPSALQALKEAISSGSSYPENIAWAYVEQGKLLARTDLSQADAVYKNALVVLPTYSQAHEGLGKDAFFKGDTAIAEKEFIAAYTILPLAQYAVDLGDLYAHEGNTTKANQEYALAQAAFNLSTKGGVNTDLEESLFLSDHSIMLPDALAMARRAFTDRPSQYGADYLAWALYKNGNASEATQYRDKAFVLGMNDPLILLHQGIIALANDDKIHARQYLQKANSLNPHFSIQYADLLAHNISLAK